MNNHIAHIAALFDPTLDAKRVAAIKAARAAGVTWQDIATAMGYDDRRAAEGWHRRHKSAG